MMPHIMDQIVGDSSESIKPLDIHSSINPLVDTSKDLDFIDDNSGVRKSIFE